MLGCVDQEWSTKYMWQTTYTKVHISVEGYGTSRNVKSKQEHVANMRELDRMINAVRR